MSKQLLKHGFIYSIAQFFIVFAGLISFPILTKNLSPQDYGIIGLFTVTTSFLASFGKLGIQHSILRLRDDYTESTFVANILFLCLAGPVPITIALISTAIIWHSFSPLTFVDIDTLLIAILVAFSEVLRAILINFFISKQQSSLVAKVRVISKTLNIVFTLSAVLLIVATSKAFIYAVFAAEIVLLIVTFVIASRYQIFKGVSKNQVDKDTYRIILVFGLPLLGLEMASMLHAFIDRYLIKYFLDDAFLGFYSAYYNMANMIAELIIGGIVLAIVPAYMQTWNQDGKQKTEQLMSNASNLFLFAYPILIASLYVVAFELFTLLTTKQYAQYYYLLPIIAAGVLLHTATPIFSAGLKIKKHVFIMLWCVLASTILNLVLNIVFIPSYGLIAAAIATTISYSVIVILFAYLGKDTVALSIDHLLFIRSSLYAVSFIILNQFIQTDSNIMTLLLKIGFGVCYFAIACLLFEKTLTRYVINIFLKRENKTSCSL